MSTDQLAIRDFVGQIVGEYQVEQVLDTEQTMVRYLGRHIERRYPVTITMYVFPETFSNQARSHFMARLETICSKLVTLRHLHLVPVYNYGEYLGAPYVITAARTGESLAHVIKRQEACTLRFTVHILKQIAEGLEYIHQHDVIHRALRPESLLFSTSQTVQVAGCGLTELVALQGIEESDHPYAHLMTIVGTFLGAPESIAPECVQGLYADRRADVYGLGIVLFELLSGKPPFKGNDPFLTAIARLQLSVPSLHALRPDLPPEIDQVISSALARDPEQRYQRVSDLVDACSQVLMEQEDRAMAFKTINPFSDSAVHWAEKMTPPAESWQGGLPITSGRIPALRIQEPSVPVMPSIQAPMESRIPAHEEEVPLFDVHFQGLDNLQYRVRAHVTHPQNHPAQSMLFPQHRQSVHAVEQLKETADPLPIVPISDPHQAESSDPASGLHQAESDQEASNSFLLRVVQPGLVGLMDGSVSTLAPIFATAFATRNPLTTFLVGMASATGAGISMAFAEALSDDGELTGRGNALLRGGVTGLMTFLSGAGHTLPFLVSDIHLALILAYVVVGVELVGIAAIRYKFFHTSWWLSLIQVVGGGLLVFLAALFLGNA